MNGYEQTPVIPSAGFWGLRGWFCRDKTTLGIKKGAARCAAPFNSSLRRFHIPRMIWRKISNYISIYVIIKYTVTKTKDLK